MIKCHIQMSLLVNVEDEVFYLTIDRTEKANSLTPKMLVNLRENLLTAQSNNQIKFIVITAQGNENFTTGIDTSIAKQLSPTDQVNLANIAGDITILLYFGKPVIAGINGRTMGMGGVFATVADYVLAVEETIIKMPEIDSLIFPSAKSIPLMNRICGNKLTKRILMLGNSLSSEEAITANIIDELVEPEAFRQRLNEVTSEFKEKNYPILRSIKFASNNAYSLPIDIYHDLEQELMQCLSWKDLEQTLKKLSTKYDLGYTLHGRPNLVVE